MAKARSPSKFAVDALLFKPEPPILPKDVKTLFYGRDKELRRGLETLKENLDLDGKRSKTADKRPWVIHGESRSGKSHLARRIFAEMPSSKPRLQCVIPAGGQLDALAVMRRLFETMRGEYMRRVLDQSLEEDPLKQPIASMVRQLIEKIGLFTGGVQTAELSYEEGRRDGLEIGAELGGAPLLAKFLAKYQAEQTRKNAIKVSLRPPTALDVGEVCGIMVETLLRLKLLRHALILMDDVDLLEAYITAQQNGRQQRSILAHALDELHATPGLDVVLTARSWYAQAQKELRTLVDLNASPPMTPEELAGVHDLRLRRYGHRGGPGSFLARPALLELGRDTEGLPGVFLQHLDAAFYQYQHEDKAGERDYAWFIEVIRRRVESSREKCKPALDAIEAAIRERRQVVDVTAGNPFFGTVLDNEFVYQSYYRETTYFISGLMRKVLSVTFGRVGEAQP